MRSNKDKKDIRGRFKTKGRVSDVYDDVELPYPDAKVTEKLCGGGACFYLPNPWFDAAMMNTFILSHGIPNVRKRLPESACLVLGRALIWLIFSPVVDEYDATEMKERVSPYACTVDTPTCGTKHGESMEVLSNCKSGIIPTSCKSFT